MRREVVRWAVVAGIFVVGGLVSLTQSPVPPATQPIAPVSTLSTSEPAAQNPPASVIAGGKLHGQVNSGNIPLPGVTVTAQNTLTGKRFSTTTDITGAWVLSIPQNGRYVLRTQFAGFAPGSQEAVLNAGSRDQTVNFNLLLASRVAQQQENETANQHAIQSTVQQLTANGAQSLSLMSAMGADTDSQAGLSGATGAALPSIAGNSDFGDDSVAISGQTGAVSPLAGLDMNRVRDAVETLRAQGVLPDGQGGGNFGGGGGMGGGFGGPSGFGGGGGRGNFRGFNPGQPHGAIFWNGSNSALNAEPFSLRGQAQQQPPSGSNRFGITFMSAPYLPGLTKPSGKDMMFLTLSGTRSSNPLDEYATVPTDGNPIFGTVNERAGYFNAVGLPTIYDPITNQPFANNTIPGGLSGRIAQSATWLLTCPNPYSSGTNCQPFFPAPNLPGYSQNYQLLTTAQNNTTQAGARYMRSLGKNATQPGGGRGGFGGGRRSQQNQGLRQSINFNYNWIGTAADNVNIFPQLGGKSSMNSNSVQAGYTVGYHKITNIFNANWNRSNGYTVNFFTDTSIDPAAVAGVIVPNDFPLNYGVPGISLSNGIQGLSETQPSFSISQTISFSEVLSWTHGKHNLRFGGDYRRVHRDFLAGSNATGNFAFTGLFTEESANGQAVQGTGSSIADFLLGLPQSTTLNSSVAKSYLRDNVYDAFVTDDWRIVPSLTLNYGVRWEFFAPYTEKYGHLAEVVTNPSEGFSSETEVMSGAAGQPNGLVYPWHKAFQPRVALAWRVPKIKQTVVRAGFGSNYTVGEYAGFATTMAHQPPFTNEQTNQEAVGNSASSACAAAGTCFTLANGFPAPAIVGNYALDPHYGLPYVMAWNLDIQKTLPWGIVMNLDYNGSRSDHLDVKLAPRALPGSPGTDPSIPNPNPLAPQPVPFNYDEAEAYFKMHQGTVRLNKRLSKGIALGANYQYGHAIDDASSVNGSSGSVVQDWQNLAAQEGHSVLDIRHQVSGSYLFELPFGPDKFWVTSGAGAHILEGFSVSGTFNFATGSWLSPGFEPTSQSVECGNSSGLRSNLKPGVSVTAGGGGLREWFNTAAYAPPSATSGYCNYFGSAPRDSIEGPGTVTNNMSLSKTMQMGDTRSMEIRATLYNVFNTVQYVGVNTTYGSPTFGEVTSVGSMRSFQFMGRFRF